MKTLKRHLSYILAINIALFILCGSACAQTTYDWRPNGSTAWTTKGNWQSTSSTGVVSYPAATYPGLTASDIVRIGVNTSIATFTKLPSLTTAGTYNITSLTFGNNNTAVGSTASLSLSLSTGVTLNVSGTVLQMHSTTGGAANSGGRDQTDDPNGFFDAINTTISGPGTLHCSYLQLGDNTIPGNPYVNNETYLFISGSANIIVDNDFVINSASYHLDDDGTVISRNNDALLSFQSGTLTISGQIKETNYNPYTYVVDQYIPTTLFSMDLYKNSNSPTLNLSNAAALNIGTSIYCSNTVDFYNVVGTGGTGVATVNYTGTNQKVYVYNAALYPDSVVDNTGLIDYDGVEYDNLGFSGSGTKTVDAGALSIQGNFTTSGTDTVDLKANNVSLSVAGTFTTGSGTALKQGSADITLTGAVTNAGILTLGTGNLYISGDYTNSGTYTQSTGTTTFNGSGTQHLKSGTGTTGTTFNNVVFSNGSNKVMQSGTFSVTSTSTLTLTGTNTKVTTGGGNLTLISDVNGAASIPALNNGCKINGSNVTVQRYVQAYRAYRLVSSPVYDSVGTTHVYSINYLKGTVPLTGTTGTAGGFDKGTNPTLYLYRENLAPLYTTFLNSNFIGISNITSAPTYSMNDATYPTTTIPVGNGYMVYYRGSLQLASLTALTTAGAAATVGTLAATGTLNQGNVTVSPWYLGGTTLGFSTASGNPAIEGGNLVGNPYASTIDWDQYGSGIIESGVAPYMYQLIPTGQQGSGNYGVYTAGSGGAGSTNGATHLIASGEGFFVFATGTGASLTFTEAAKVSSQVTGSALFMAKRIPTQPVTQYLKLRMAMDTINSDESVILFNDKAANIFNPMEDARYRAGTGKVSLSTFSADNVAVAINQMPLALKGDTIKLNINATATGTYTLNLVNVQGIPQIYDIWLKDAFAKDSVNLRNTTTYSFTVNTGDTTTFGANRFKLVLVQDPALAYKLISFDAEKTAQKQVQLTWKTVNEANYTSFTVERSTNNGNTYQVVGSSQSTGAGTYSLLDRNPVRGSNLYRLKQQDLNNVITYSDVITVMFQDNGNDKGSSLTCYPNPAITTINLNIAPKSQTATTYDIKITNSSGMVVRYATVSNLTWQDNVSNLLTGTYLVQVTDAKDNSIVGRTKFVKL